jgi:2-keto-4-pentenoate hydratase/2-oxohepta-3-ene-1,7-dioic acid hydratase in catechol pathway
VRLAVFGKDSRLGLLLDGAIVDVSDLVGAGGTDWPPVFLLRAIADFDRLRPQLLAALEQRPGIPLDRVRLRAPAVFPSKVIAAPVNYRLHIEEMRPLIKGELHAIERYGVFLKAPSSIVGPEATIELPFPDRRTDHEVELGVVIGRTARNVAMADAMAHVFGYTGVMDVTVRGDEDRSTRKSFDTFTPVGPVLVTADEIPSRTRLELQLWSQRGAPPATAHPGHDLERAEAHQYASHVMTLNPGDLLSTGTPDGVGPLRPGDHVTMEVECVGRLSVRVELRKP